MTATRRFRVFGGVLVGELLGIIAFTPMNIAPLVALALGVLALVLAYVAAVYGELWLDERERRQRHRDHRQLLMGVGARRDPRRWR